MYVRGLSGEKKNQNSYSRETEPVEQNKKGYLLHWTHTHQDRKSASVAIPLNLLQWNLSPCYAIDPPPIQCP